MAAAPDPSLHVLAHVFKVTVDPFVGKLGIFRVHQGTVTQRQPALHRRRPQALQGRATCSCCRARTTWRCRARCRATSPRWPRSTRSTSTPCCTTPPRTTTSTSRRCDFPDAGARPGDRAQAPRRRAAHVGDPGQAGRRGPLPAGSSTWRRPTRPSSTAWASCTCACCSSGCARSTASRSTPGRRASPTARRSRRRPRATTATRSRPAAPASSARCSCASSRCRAAPASSSSTRSRAARSRASSSPRSRRACARCWQRGAIAGYPVVDVRVMVYDGKHHSVDSKDIAFATAGRKAFIAAIRDGARRSCWSRSCTSRSPRPDTAIGDITGDLSSRRGLVSGTANGAAGHDAGARPGAAVGAVGLPVAAQRDDQRPGPLHASSCRTTRRCRRTRSSSWSQHKVRDDD